MADGAGVAEFPRQPFTPGCWLDGQAFVDGYSELDPSGPTGTPALLPMADGSFVEQRVLRGPSAPASVAPLSFSLKVGPVSWEEDYFLILGAVNRGATVTFFPGMPIVDTWDVVAGQSAFTLSRVMPYGTLTGPNAPTTTSHPIRAYLNGVEKTVIYSGTPSAGQILIDTTALAQHGAVVPGDALSNGDVIRVRYYAMFFVAFDPQSTYPEFNNYGWTGTLREKVAGDWS